MDVLVHDALYAPAVDRLVAGVPNATTWSSPPTIPQMWIDAARKHFRGSVVVGRDLLEV